MKKWLLASALLLPVSAWAQTKVPTADGSLATVTAQGCPTGATSGGLPVVSPSACGGTSPTVPSYIKPAPVTPSTQLGGTVTTGGTFQTVLAANSLRSQCTIQNTSTHTAYVYWLATGTASLTNSLQITPGGTFQCAGTVGPGPVQTAIQWTTSTTADPFNYSESQ